MVVGLILGFAFFAGLHAVLQKWMIRNGDFSVKSILIWQNLIAAVVIISTAPWGDFGVKSISGVSPIFWWAIGLTTIANIGIQWANITARELADASLTAPIQALTPALITLAALVLHEYPSGVGIIGISMIAVGIFIHLSEDAKTLGDYLRPFKLWRLPPNFEELTQEGKQKARNNRRALVISYGSASLGTVGLIGDSVSARAGGGDLAFGFAVHLIVLAIVFAVIVPRKKRTNSANAKPSGRRYWLPILAMGLAFGLLVFLPLLAFRVAPVAYVGSLKRLGIVVTVLLAWLFLGEARAPRRLIPALVVTVGAIILFLDPASTKIVEAAQKFSSIPSK